MVGLERLAGARGSGACEAGDIPGVRLGDWGWVDLDWVDSTERGPQQKGDLVESVESCFMS